MARALRPLDPDFEATLAQALEKRAATRALAREAVAGGVTDVVFVGVGGSYSSSIHAHFFLDRLSTRLRAANLNAAEFLHAPPRRIGPNTLVVASSHGGATPETVAAANLARDLGARLVSVCSEPDTPLGRLGHATLTYGSDRTITPAKQILLLELVIDLLHEADGLTDFDELDRGLTGLAGALREALEDSEASLNGIARRLDDHRPVWVVAAGPNLGAAYTMSVCYLVEMQWMPSAHFAAGDYLHGPFELLTEDAQLLLFAGEDATRAETDRVERFAQRYAREPHVIGSTGLRLTGVPAGARGTLAGIALGVLSGRLLDHLEAARDHDHAVRRYMHQVEY